MGLIGLTHLDDVIEILLVELERRVPEVTCDKELRVQLMEPPDEHLVSLRQHREALLVGEPHFRGQHRAPDRLSEPAGKGECGKY